MGLFKPAWMGESNDKALKSVQKETDQTKLTEIAKTSPHWNLRRAAVDKLTDQRALADIAKNDSAFDVRFSAIRAICNCNKSFISRTMWDNLFSALTDQSMIADIFGNYDDADVKWGAFRKLTDKTILHDIAKNNTDKIWRVRACEKLTEGKHQIENCTCKLCGEMFHDFQNFGSTTSHNEKHPNGYDMTITIQKIKCVKCGLVSEKEDIERHGYDSDYNR